MDPPGDRLFAGMGAGGEPARPHTERLHERRQLRRVDRQGRCREFEIAHGRYLARAEKAKPFGICFGLAEAEIEGGQELPRELRIAPPARE
jgi:hypothetical protein